MRRCAGCNKEDRPQVENPGECTCGMHSPDPLSHDVNCWAIGHEVVQYPVRMMVSELTFDRELPPRFLQKGWKLLQNGSRYYRVKLLCHACVESEVSARQRKEDYVRACRRAKGLDTMTYAQMLAMQ